MWYNMVLFGFNLIAYQCPIIWRKTNPYNIFNFKNNLWNKTIAASSEHPRIFNGLNYVPSSTEYTLNINLVQSYSRSERKMVSNTYLGWCGHLQLERNTTSRQEPSSIDSNELSLCLGPAVVCLRTFPWSFHINHCIHPLFSYWMENIITRTNSHLKFSQLQSFTNGQML